MRVIEGRALRREAREGCVNYSMLRIGAASDAKENVRIYETLGNRHSVVFLIDPFAGDYFRQWWNLIRKLREGI